MDDIEKLIVRLPRPSPSPDLQDRIWQITNPPAASPPVGDQWRRDRWRSIAVLVTSVACAGVIGFILGRNSAPAPAPAVDVASTVSLPTTSQPVLPNTEIVHYPPEEALTRFVMLPKRTESLFGPAIANHQAKSSPLD